jgi:hypothetical protein
MNDMKFVILLEKTSTPEAFQKLVPAHVAHLDRLHEQGVLIAAGPFRDGSGGLILIEAENEAAAKAVAEDDPFVSQGAERYTLKSWEVLTACRPELLTRDG